MMRSICLTTSVAFEAVKDCFELSFWVSPPGGEGAFYHILIWKFVWIVQWMVMLF